MKPTAIALLALSLLAPTLIARDHPAPTEPGTYKVWGQDIDQIEIVKTFKIADYDKIVVEPFDTSAVPLPDEKDKSYNSRRSVLDGYTLTLVEAFRPELKAKADITISEKKTKAAKTLIVRGKVEDLTPGSRAKRYLAGFGAGAAGTKFSGEIVDAKSGEALARFTQERRSGGTFKFAGGNDMDVMRDAIHASGKDIAHILDAFD
jgi:Domain of unknown function (DUF4410)